MVGEKGPEEMNENSIHDRVVRYDLLNIWELLSLQKDNELGEQSFELEVVVKVSLILSLLGEKDLELRMKNDSS